ncbi:MAG: sodium:solute symporter family protein [Bacteroidota bacterium]
MPNLLTLGWIDYGIIIIYFMFVIGIGWALKRYMSSSKAFLEAGRSLPAWVTGLAFISANLGALEVIGMSASGAQYGMATTHFYWIGAIPAMIFLALFMMPFYYGSKARSVPEYLKLRFDEKTRGLNAVAFALMTVLASGISMYALAFLMEKLLHWPFDVSILVSAGIVLVYTYLGGLSSAIYNEVLQFFIIVIGLFPLVFLSLKDAGGWSGMSDTLSQVAVGKGFQPGAWTQMWSHAGSTSSNPMGVEWFGILMGLGFVLSFGYWCTNFLVVQRAMAANSMNAARKTPLIGALPKIFIPFLVIVPGMAAMALASKGTLTLELMPNGSPNYNSVITSMLSHYYPSGILGLGITALLASFMSGMAGNVSAFNTVWTYDIYQSYIKPGQNDNHYLKVGKIATIFGVLLSVGAAYLAKQFGNIMDFLQMIFSMVNAPLFAVLFLGMFWKRATGNAAFWGLLVGICCALVHHGLTIPIGADPSQVIKGGWISILHTYPSGMAQSFWTAIIAWTSATFFTVGLTFLTKQLKSNEDLKGLVYSLTPRLIDKDDKWYNRPVVLAVIVGLITLVLSIIFW